MKLFLVLSLFLSHYSNAQQTMGAQAVQTVNGATEKILKHSKPGEGLVKKTFTNKKHQQGALKTAIRTLPALFEIDQRILRIEANVARIIQTQGPTLEPRHINQISRLAEMHSTYEKARGRFVQTIQLFKTTLMPDLARHTGDMRNQLRRANPGKKVDGRINNYKNGRIWDLKKVPGDYGARNLLSQLDKVNSKRGDFIRDGARKIHRLYSDRTGKTKPPSKPRRGGKTAPGAQIDDIAPNSSM